MRRKGSSLADEEIEVRLIAPGEEQEVTDSLLAAYESSYEINDEYRAWILDVPARVADNEVWVARGVTSGQLYGSFVVRRPGAEALLDHTQPDEFDFKLLGVDPSVRRHGVGAYLVDQIIELARQRGFARVVLNSVDYMVPAHRLYERLGFDRLTERTKTKDDGTVVYVFGRDI